MKALSKRRVWHYSGDVDIQHGGTFYNMDNWQYDYVEAVRCVPCSDAGGPDNQFWVEDLTINIPHGVTKLETDAARVKLIVDCGMDPDEYAEQTEKQQRHWLVDACLSYGTYDINTTFEVQVGKAIDPFWSGHDFVALQGSDLNVLRGNASLRRWVRSRCDTV